MQIAPWLQEMQTIAVITKIYARRKHNCLFCLARLQARALRNGEGWPTRGSRNVENTSRNGKEPVSPYDYP